MSPLLRAKAAAVVIVAALMLTACMPVTVKPMESVTFHQYQSIENFDSSEYTQSDQGELDRLKQLFERFRVTPGQTVTTVEDECAGGLSTTFAIAFDDGSSAEMYVADCGKPQHAEFNSSANDLFWEWREELSAE
jgi:hypothetical protein